MKSLPLKLFLILAMVLPATVSADIDEDYLADLRLTFLRGMSSGIKAEYGLPRFFDSEKAKEAQFWEIADKYLIWYGIEKERLRDGKTLEGLGQMIYSNRSILEEGYLHKLVFLSGIYYRNGTEEGITSTGTLNLIQLFQGIIKHQGSLQITINPGYPGNTIYVFEDEEDRRIFKEVMTQVHDAMLGTIPISEVKNNQYTKRRGR